MLKVITTTRSCHMQAESTHHQLTSLNRIPLFPAAFIALLLFVVPCRLPAGVTHHGNPFVPAGANFQIVGLQGIDASTPTGKTSFSPQVNTDFEFTPSIGVSWDQGNGHLTDFGIGLYSDAAHTVQSTGLEILYNQPVLASSVTITVQDFDIKVGDAFFNPNKVEPSILLLGPGGSIYASATPADVFANLAPHNASKSKADIWDVNFAGLLSTLGKADAPISGYILYADATAGEIPNSDPYLLVSAGNSLQVPEPGSFLLLIVAGSFSCLFHGGRAFLKNKARE
jgi:hypothetical protein